MIADHEVFKIMEETGMDFIQAYRHLQQRKYLKRRFSRCRLRMTPLTQ